MPKVFDVGPYTIYFWVAEGNPIEPVHVHVTEGVPAPNDTKFWITKSGGALLCHNEGNIAFRRLRQIRPGHVLLLSALCLGRDAGEIIECSNDRIIELGGTRFKSRQRRSV